ncbi:hypothetical protein FB554_2103 [Barrientosiimonas humi]|uniref:Uncharacterized protein n=1 Tax=Barrientosiimonas humi TaxID=999931 RepID=A0A542XDV7_9MICO|nr:hypothetical protein [Barrientosiimonas humi]TQL33946.1 hypothetical protein FB554_2103 [Barrientosiimonas humi]CAG7573936.1 hypothetical protein BH39T_PBIAJDOK_02578 [Barrientosiimonas humi]
MDSSNHWYRHAHIWSAYCGLGFDQPPRINGVIQHGWTFVHGFGAGHAPPHGFAKYVWSDVNRRRGQAVGWRDYVVTGAPFLYLEQMTPPDPQAPEPEGTIWYPFHGTVDYEAVSGDHDRLIDEIHAVEDGPVTMCLYYVEYAIDAIREKYEDAGFRVITHGERGVKWTGGNPDFLPGQLRELRRHKRVASNRLSTAIMYGASLGLQPAVYGDPMDLVGVKAGFNGSQLLEFTFPQLHGTDIDAELARQVADVELGRDAMLEPQELALVLGWEQEWRESNKESA